jgi:hypothetical protein
LLSFMVIATRLNVAWRYLNNRKYFHVKRRETRLGCCLTAMEQGVKPKVQRTLSRFGCSACDNTASSHA